MKQQAFETSHQTFWGSFDDELTSLESRKLPKNYAAKAFSSRYRQICQHLAIARDRHYAPYLIEKLNLLAIRGHQQLYQRQGNFLLQTVTMLARDFPIAVRQNWQLFWLFSLLFYGSGFLTGLAVYIYPELIYSFMDYGSIQQLEQNYSPEAHRIGSSRESADDIYMFGFYIMNNIGIGFRTFASGILWGLGTLFFVLFNGLQLGAVSGHLLNVGYSENLFTFVIAHGAFELTAIVIAGMAGMKLGLSLLKPGNDTRMQALRKAATAAMPLVYGMIFFLLIAAFIEAFWSSTQGLSSSIKYGVGGLCWFAVMCYLALAGKESRL